MYSKNMLFHPVKLQCLPAICHFGIQGWRQRKLRKNPLSCSCEPINAVTLYKWVSKGKYLPWFRSNLKIIKRILMFNILKYWIFKPQYFYLGFAANFSKEWRLLIVTDWGGRSHQQCFRWVFQIAQSHWGEKYFWGTCQRNSSLHWEWGSRRNRVLFWGVHLYFQQ